MRLHILYGGQEYIVNTSGVAGASIDQLASDANVFFNVHLGNDTDVQFYAEVDPNNLYGESNEGNNRYPASGTLNLRFHKRAEFDVVGWSMFYHPIGATDSGVAGGWAVNRGGADYLNAIWPVETSGINYKMHSGYFDWYNVIPTGGQEVVIGVIKSIYSMAIYPWGDYELRGADRVHVWTPRSHEVRGSSDPGFIGGHGVASVGDDRPSTAQTVDDPGFGAYTFAHELSHNTGMYHTDIANPECDTSTHGHDWPYADASIQEFGYNPDSGRVYDPASTYDIMSYCYTDEDAWISPFHWTQQFNVEGASVGPIQPQSVGSGVVAITATLDNPDLNGDTGGSLGTMHLSEDGENNIASPQGTGYTVQLRSGAQVLGSQAFSVSFVPVDTDGASADANATLPSADAVFTMPWVDGTTSVILLRGTEVLDTVEVSGNAPTVQVTSPSQTAQWPADTTQTLTWSGADTDSDTLTYTVFYSHAGDAWEVLATGLSGPTFDVDVDSIAGGAQAKFRVLASDGVNTGYGDSAEVSIPNKPPFVAITGPADGVLAQEGSVIVFSGGAADLEDGEIADAGLAWHSDQDGDLGNGRSLPLNALSPGEHTITLTATDGDGASVSESISVVVGIVGRLDVRPIAVDPDGTGDVLVVLTLPPGISIDDVDQSSLRVQISDTELTAVSVDQLSDLDLDGLPSITLMLDGDAARAAFVDENAQTTIHLTGVMDDDTELGAHGFAGLVHPGDVNCSGDTNGTDVTLALANYANVARVQCLFAGDFDCDGFLTPKEVLETLGKLAGLTIGSSSCLEPETAQASAAQIHAHPRDGGGNGLGAIARSGLFWPALLLVPALVLTNRWEK